MRDHEPQRSGVMDFLFGAARDAIADIRGKLIDEGWFGRRSHDAGGMSLGQQWSKPTILDRPSFEEQWAVRAPAERGADAPGLDIDR